MDRQLLARIAKQGGGKLVDLALGKAAPDDMKKRSLTGKIAGVALTRIATRSVPGAIIVGGGMLAKALFDRRHARKGKQKNV